MTDQPKHKSATLLIAEFEGLSLKPYLCPAKVWTIGFGSTRDKDGKKVTRDTPPITDQDAWDLLFRDADKARQWVNGNKALVKVPLTSYQVAALTSFVYNVGPTNFRASTLLKRINQGNFDDVRNQLLRWVYGGGRKLAGLERRRIAEAYLWLGEPT